MLLLEIKLDQIRPLRYWGPLENHQWQLFYPFWKWVGVQSQSAPIIVLFQSDDLDGLNDPKEFDDPSYSMDFDNPKSMVIPPSPMVLFEVVESQPYFLACVTITQTLQNLVVVFLES